MSETYSLEVGADVGDCRIDENSATVLRLAVPQVLAVICVALGLAALTGYSVMVSPRIGREGLLETVFSGGLLEKFLLLAGFAVLLVGVSQLGVSYTIDGGARTVTKRRVVVMWRRAASEFESVLVSVSHQGPNEILVLSLVPPKGDQVVLGMTPSDDRGLPLIATAARISELLELPIVRQGTPVQGT